ncbi:MAG: SMP-30/gluconolactonase/LRE family protein [Rhodobacteraceae bacterium]|nr:SMP-30/gluconolactonase/LRE family protein [Paracoccaceae bacterium]
MRSILLAVLVCLVAGVLYLLTWPVPIDPKSWTAPENAGYSGDFAANTKLANLRRVSLGAHSGPEDVAIGPDGLAYITTHDGVILRYDRQSGNLDTFADTGGRPLGLEFASDGQLYVADAYRGLLVIDATGDVTLLADQTSAGDPILYADDVDIAPDGRVYFSDASTKFGAEANGGTLPASILDLMEHGSNGRVLRFDPSTGETDTVVEGLNFANGIAMTADGQHVMIVDTGTYAVWKWPVAGGAAEVIVENLPGFPDNINRAPDGTFWVGLVSPRNAPMDALSGSPNLRKMVQRLPASMRPAAQRYGFVLQIDETGNVLQTLQDPSGAYALTTGLIEAPDGTRYISSLTEPDLGVMDP